jgi:6-phosphogluconolactonase/glucosamine-6-phosphate isomerase/deaminase
MRLDKHLNELAMKANTKIITKKGRKFYDADITLSSGDYFQLTIEKGSFLYQSKKGEIKLEEWEIVFEDERGFIKTNKRGTKVALELFAAIESVVSDFINIEEPDAILFTGTGKSKIKLYNLLARKIAKGGYVIRNTTNEIFSLIRKDLI